MHHSCGVFHQISHYVSLALQIHQRAPETAAFTYSTRAHEKERSDVSISFLSRITSVRHCSALDLCLVYGKKVHMMGGT